MNNIKHKKTWVYGFISMFFALSLLVMTAYSKDAVNPEPAKTTQTDLQKYDFTLKDQDAEPVKLSDLEGKIVVLEWTNYDCPFVKDHYDTGRMPALAQKLSEKGVVWLAVNSTHYADIEGNKKFAETHGLTYKVLDDSKGEIGRKFKATNTPQIYIFDAKGKLVYQGAVDNQPLGRKADEFVNYAEKAIDELLAGKEVTTASTKPYGCTVKYAK